MASVAPCALTSNIAALAYVSERLSSPAKTALAGLAYMIGRALAYAVTGLVILAFGMAIIENLESLQTVWKIGLGFIFIIVGAIILEQLKFNFSVGDRLKSRYLDKFSEGGIAGSFGLGILFSLAFCPIMAGIFFGLLMPLAFSTQAVGAGLPALFGIGTGLPVLVFAGLLALGVSQAESYVDRVRRIEPYVRKLFGAGLVLYGFYLILILIM